MCLEESVLSVGGLIIKSNHIIHLSYLKLQMEAVCVLKHMPEEAFCACRHVEEPKEALFKHLLEVIYNSAAGPYLKDPLC